MPVVASYHYLLGPAVAFIAVAVLILLSRWAFSTGSSVVGRRRVEGSSADYGLLVSVADVRTREDAEMLREVLAGHGIRATVVGSAPGAGSPVRVLVFPHVAERASEIVALRR